MSSSKRGRAQSVDSLDEAASPFFRSLPRRTTVACIECRIRKSKCDGLEPCSNCLKDPHRLCEYRNVTAEENQAARRKKHYPDSSHTSKISKGKRATAARRRPRKTSSKTVPASDELSHQVKPAQMTEEVPRQPVKAQGQRRALSLSTSAPKVPASPSCAVHGSAQGSAMLHHLMLDSTRPQVSAPHPLFIDTPPFPATSPIYYPPKPYFREPTSPTYATPYGFICGPALSPTTQLYSSAQAFVFQPPPSSPPAAYHLPLPAPTSCTPPLYPTTFPPPLPYPTPTDSTSVAEAYPFPSTSQLGPPFQPIYCTPQVIAPVWQTPPAIDAVPYISFLESLPLALSFASRSLAHEEESIKATPTQLHTPRSNPCSPTVADTNSYFPAVPFDLERDESFGAPGQWVDELGEGGNLSGWTM